MNSKHFALILVLFSFFHISFSQENTNDNSKWNWDKVRYGGALAVDFSSNTTSVIASPSAVYQISNKFSAGLGVNFGYSRFRRTNTNQFNYGGSLITLYNPINEIQLSAELEQTFVNSSRKTNDIKVTDNFNFPALYLGAAYRIKNVSIGARYDVLFKENKSIYASAISPFVRVYF